MKLLEINEKISEIDSIKDARNQKINKIKTFFFYFPNLNLWDLFLLYW